MPSPTASLLTREKTPEPAFRLFVLHDDHLTARRGELVAAAIAEEMGLGEECIILLWNIDLLDTPFGRVPAVDAGSADIVIIALRGPEKISMDLKRLIGDWLVRRKHSSAALVIAFESRDEPGARKARALIERLALDAGRDFFRQRADACESSPEDFVHEFLWVL